MSDKSNKYGYVGVDIPAQSFGANKGVFNPAEINELVADNKWTSFGQLELIETNDITGASELLLDNLQTNTYRVHFLTYNDVGVSVDAQAPYIRYYESGVEESASVYQHANIEGRASGSFFDVRSTAYSAVRLTGNGGNQTNEKENGYVYFYDLGDNSQFSFSTSHNSNYNRDPSATFNFGSQVLPQASTVDKIKFYVPSGTFTSGSVSFYGVREYA